MPSGDVCESTIQNSSKCSASIGPEPFIPAIASQSQTSPDTNASSRQTTSMRWSHLRTFSRLAITALPG